MPQKLLETNKRGFTLVELLVVIAILAALAVAVVLTLNPAELIKRARDATRVSDLSAVQSAIALYLADVENPTWTVTSTCTNASSTGRPFTDATTSTCDLNATTSVNGSGWVNVNFAGISVGSPLGKLPLDPVNSTCTATGTPSLTCKYIYVSSSTNNKYKLFTNMESVKYAPLEAADGGKSNSWYEAGNLDVN